MNHTKIEWTESTWNPTTGCTKISSGCKNCYAERLAKRLKAMGQEKYVNGFDLTLHPNVLEEPCHWKLSRLVFVNSMSDLFHEDIPLDFIKLVFKVMNENPRHTFQVLTKRSSKLLECAGDLTWTPNIWMGVTVEDQDNLYRVDHLRQTDAIVKFISFEPLLGEISQVDFCGIDWVIVGGESGPGARTMKPEWVSDLKVYCQDSNVPFFFKQWGGTNKKKTGRILDGRTWDEKPQVSIA